MKETGGVLSLTDSLDKKTVLDALREKHLEPRKTNMNYLVSNEHPNCLLSIHI